MNGQPMAQPVQWSERRSPQFEPALRALTTVVLPIGSTEQHGPHLPVQVDTLLASEVAQRAAARTDPRAPMLVLPPLWVSLAEHHMRMAGTLTLDVPTMHAFIRCVVLSLQRQGYRRVLLLNGHGGNIAALSTIADQLAIETAMPVVAATYWLVAGDAFAPILQAQSGLLHACEAETSMLMHLRPDLVNLAAAGPIAARPSGFLEPAGTHRWRQIAHWSCDGIVGVPQQASAAKGERLLGAAVDALLACLAAPSFWSEDPPP
ncbi:creatininase family protein [Hydrogenophaga sp.]|uniref:creatininase family protein n=1 Tax=Hydrogenophaga sp. TaxID=1904254 RepID=UPI002FC9C237